MPDILTRTVAPLPLLTLTEAKSHLRVDHSDDDVLIAALVEAVTASLDGPSGEYGFPVTTQRWSLTVEAVAGQLALPITPAVALVSLTYWPDGGGAQVTANLADYRMIGNDTSAYVEPLSKQWPLLADRPDALTVTWTAGYAVVPADVKHTARLMLGDFYEHREAQVVGVAIARNQTLDRLITLRKRWWLS